jgi:hypothetical protein
MLKASTGKNRQHACTVGNNKKQNETMINGQV